jgi:hypothetical protein
MSSARLEEWQEIKTAIELFCRVVGLTVNQTKSIILSEGLSDLELAPFKALLNFSFRALADGFKYLGYYLKTGPHRATDWDWLVSRFSQKITRWYNRWLSLGGRYILIKSVLEAQPVFWMSMESVPRSIINKIRKVIFHYLWNGCNDSCQFHLCRWEMLSRPKRNGGWGSLTSIISIWP